MKLFMIIGGLILCLASLWGGGYFVGLFTYHDWQRFPTIATALLCFAVGAALFCFALFEYKPDTN